jgi:hypothetical protein
MKKYFKLLTASALVFFITSCEDLELDSYLDNPNQVSVDKLDVNLLMNQIQADFALFIENANYPTSELTRMRAMTGGDTYERAYLPQSQNSIWNSGYQDVLVNIETLLSKTDGTGLTHHSGAARVLKAYTYLTLVDLYGSVPYSEASKASTGNFNPKVDDGKAIYEASIKMLDEAIELFGKTPTATMARDVFYSSSASNWIAAANTIKLKAYLNTRLTDAAGAKTKIADLLTKNLIDTDAEQFVYRYGTADVPQRSRNDWYLNFYTPNAGSPEDYLGNYFMFISYKQKGVEDPRWRYYFYRQVGSIARALRDDPKSIPCRITPKPEHYPKDMVWCTMDPGFLGRDHGNNDGVPPDSKARTCVGSYPAGGLSDKNEGNTDFAGYSQRGQGGNGAGILPILMNSFTDFMKAEAALTLGTAGNAKDLMLSGVKKSINFTRSFSASLAISQKLPDGLEASQTAYEAKVAGLYDAASNKLDVISKEYLIALWGNGIEAYNMYRRTGGLPSDMQPIRAALGGKFFRTLVYPSDYVNLNSNAKQKVDPSVKVFWDNYPDGSIK